jgi:RecB family exonuclease
MFLPLYYAIVPVVIFVLLLYLLFHTRRRVQTYRVPKGQVVYGDMLSQAQVLTSKKYHLSGKPDKVIESKGSVIPYEFKSGTAGMSPWEPHRIQMGVYFIILQELYPDRDVSYGIIKYRNESFYVENTPELREIVLKRADTIRRTRGLTYRNHDNPNKCAACKYREICKERLI